MSDIKELTKLIKSLEDQLVVCMRCGMCQSVCPLFEQTGREADVARGKLALLDGLMQEMFEDPEGVYARLNKCLLCGSCAANCPSGVSVLEIFMKARVILTGFMGLSPAKKLILRGMLARPDLFDTLAEWGARFQNIFTRPVNNVVGTSCARVVSPLIKDRHFKNLAEKPFHKIQPSLDTQPGKSGIRAGFYVGCLLDKIFPHIAQAVVDVLNYHQVGIYMPEKQACCGIPAVSSGDMQTFNKLLFHNLECFSPDKFDYLVTACATCTSTIKEVWPMMADREHKNLIKKISDKTMDINDFLVSVIKVNPENQAPEKNRIPITYHDPCHLKKSLKVAAQPRALIKANSRYELKEMLDSDWCCGMGGSFNLQYYDISSKIGNRKRDNIVSTGCKTVATGCPACMLQISDMLSKNRDQIAVRHPIEIYLESLKL
ncbi:Lactate dehydrogenase, subunit beta [Desulfonema limicola]|uniref:Glycolate oxidase iron-sulfur subunit n=1 Tax=Desulfonema limicola TaxID=45656 RepID=A0A975BBC4_9BACT|nr:(Fe-S)-binding protein [Desulfonema limicola]QTA82119.1 Lactate dehydrogenase, subunit beta [Desulfonema limicola]